MNEFIENQGVHTNEEFMRLVNEKLALRDTTIKPITLDEARFYNYEMGLGVDTVVEEHMHFEHVYG